MAVMNPVTELQRPYSDEGTEATSWATGRKYLDTAEVYWISTVRPDGRPHVTPMIGIWLDEALHFCTGPDERKARNLDQNTHCVITTGCNSMTSKFDVIVERDVRRVTDVDVPQCLAASYATKFGWEFTVDNGIFRHDAGGEALVFVMAPVKAFGYGREGTYTATRWRFDRESAAGNEGP